MTSPAPPLFVFELCDAHTISLKQALADHGLSAWVDDAQALCHQQGGFAPYLGAVATCAQAVIVIGGADLIRSMINNPGDKLCAACYLIANCPCGAIESCEFAAKWAGVVCALELAEGKKRGLIHEA